MAKGSERLSWTGLGLSPEHRVCAGCGAKLRIQDVVHWDGFNRMVWGACCPVLAFSRNTDPGDEDGT